MVATTTTGSMGWRRRGGRAGSSTVKGRMGRGGNGWQGKDGSVIWEWDKRAFTKPELPPYISDPPAENASESQILLVWTLNNAIDALSRKDGSGTRATSLPRQVQHE
ncbi:hypothetical protein CBR_g4285 [Chara braunii]|uniref:Uncharacterized protein n=1 Tax=Chara braunii TaxID=69332 RepID=A0A388JR76_CHABU|nr:hypothetical protein CBR_g4285 [Chara braunii]|eukprot:GBG60329.1 hypothetical protein CBR_g4285 [Chara braunii]